MEAHRHSYPGVLLARADWALYEAKRDGRDRAVAVPLATAAH